jgi:hypothetical protein
MEIADFDSDYTMMMCQFVLEQLTLKYIQKLFVGKTLTKL